MLKKTTTNYHAQLKASEYDYLEVTSDDEGRIKIKFLEERWRTPEETAVMLEEVIHLIGDFQRATKLKPTEL